MGDVMMSDDDQEVLRAAWAAHRARLEKQGPPIRPIWWVIGWTFGLPTLVSVIDGRASISAFFWWGLLGYLLVGAWYAHWRQKAVAACYMHMSDAFASYVMEHDDLEGALVWQDALYQDKRRLMILAVPFPNIRDRDEALDREVGF